MSVLVLGLSHHSAPMALLERVSLDPDGADRLARRVAAAEAVEGAVVLSTCNRLELYAGALTFHAALTSMGEALAAESGVALGALREHLYVHYEDRAVAHACSVAAGLDSMAVGESQILGQLREAYRASERSGLVPEEAGRSCDTRCTWESARMPRRGSTGSATPSCSPASRRPPRGSGPSSRPTSWSSGPAA